MCAQVSQWIGNSSRSGLGHASVVTTMQTYVHLEQEDYQLAYHTFVTRRNAAYAHL